jgi:SAM-dependent methyltransferase
MPGLATKRMAGAAAAPHNDRQARAWSTFWAEQGADSRCLANAGPAVRRALDAHWSAFAATLPAGARILDIGCGAGIVARALLAARGDLALTGVDLARVPPASDRRIALLSATPMESLPFGDGCFDAAVSQFGFEYGDVAAAAREMARVLAQGARFSFVVHHGASAIVRQGQARAPALRIVLGGEVKRAFLAGAAAALEQALRPAHRAASADPLIGQAVGALRARTALPSAQRVLVWNKIVEALAPEQDLIAALLSACVSPSRLETWLAGLSSLFEVTAASPLCAAAGNPIGWRIEGVKERARS